MAKKLGLGKATVCRALGNTGSVSPHTREKVVRMARALGYRPDPALSALAHRRWKKRTARGIPLGFFFPAEEDVFSRACLEAVQTQAFSLGYSVTPYFMRDFASHGHASQVLYHRGVKGLIVAHQPRSAPALQLNWEHFAVVSCGVRVDRFPSAIVMPNVFNGMKLCWRAAHEAGYKKMGIVFMKEGPDDNTAYQIGAFLSENGGRSPIPILMNADEFESWHRKYRPEVILGSNLELYDALCARGWRFPRDGSFVCFGWNDRLGQIAGLDLHMDMIARSALELIDLQLRLSQREPVHRNKITHMIEPSWVPGITLVVKK